jgi:hypothetical protein
LAVVNPTGGYTNANYVQIASTTANDSNYPGIEFKGGTYATTYPFVRLSNGGLAIFMVGGYSATYPGQTLIGCDAISGLFFQTSTSGYPSDRMRITTSGLVGINETSPGAQLQVTTAAAATKGLIVKGASAQSANLQEWQNSSGVSLLHINSNGDLVKSNAAGTGPLYIATENADGIIYRADNNGHRFQSWTSSWVDNMVIQENGNVGIGTSTNPSGAKLEIQTADGADALGMSGYKVMKWENGTELAFGGYAAGNWTVLKLYTSAAERLRIDSSGNIGIGAAPVTGYTGYRLQVGSSADSQTYITMGNSTTGLGPLNGLIVGCDASNAYLLNRESTGLRIGTNNTDRILIASDGLVSITAAPLVPTPGAQLQVTTAAAATKGLIVRGASGQSANLQEWQNSSGTALAAIDSAGNMSAANFSGASISSSVMSQSFVKEHTFYRSVPTTVGNYVELCDYNEVTGFIEITAASESGNGIGHTIKRYYLAAVFNQTRNCILCPIAMDRQSGYTSTFDFEIESVNITSYTNRLRIRRTAGTSARGMTVTVKLYSPYGHSLTEQNGTGTSTIGNGFWNSLVSTVLYPPPVVGGSGSGSNLNLYAGAGEGAGGGGSIILNAGDPAGTASGGSIYLYNKNSAANTGASAVVLGYMNSHAWAFHAFNRTLPDAVGDYVEVCAFNAQIGGWIDMEVVINKHASSYGCKTYSFGNLYYTGVGILQPVSVQGAGYAGFFYNNFEVELDCTSTSQSVVRIRRTAADASNVSVPLYISIRSRTSGLTNRTGTGTSTAGSSIKSTERVFPTYIAPMSPPGNSGNGLSVTVTAGSGAGTGTGGNLNLLGGNASTTGAGGSVILQAGAQASTGGNGKVIVRGLASNTANLQEWQNNAGTSLASIESTGRLVSTGALIYNQSASVPTLQVRSGNPSTTSIQQWQNYYGTVLASVDASGNFNTPNLYASTVWSSQWFDGGPYVFSRIFTRNGNLPSVVGDYIELFECARSRSSPIRILINANDPNQGRIYDIVFDSTFNSGSGGIVIPTYSGGDSSSNDFVLEVSHVDGNYSRFRLRRTAGTSNRAFQAHINIQVGNTGAESVVLKSGTGTSTIGSSEYGNNSISTSWIRAQNSSAYSGAGRSVTITAADGRTSGAGGDIILQGGAQASTGGNGKVIVRGLASNTANLQEWQNNSGTALASVDASGNIKTSGSIQITSNTPAAFTADQNNLVLSASGFQRLSGTAARTITGIAPPSGASHVDGRMMRIYNVGSYNITLKHNSTSSSIANRFCCVQAIDIVLGPRDFAELIYDGTDGGLVSGQNNPCWRVA